MNDNIYWQYVVPVFPEPSLYEEGTADKEFESESVETFMDMLGPPINYPRGILTTAGVIPIDENYNPYDFWVGHTDFRITKSISDIITNTTGVEIFIPITQHRFKIAIGRAWCVQQKRNEILNLISKRVKDRINKYGKQEQKIKTISEGEFGISNDRQIEQN